MLELETLPVLKACTEARAALAELKQAAEMIPNRAMLINTIPLLESKASSEIENIVTTTDQLFQYAQATTTPILYLSRHVIAHKAASRLPSTPQRSGFL